MDSNAIAIYEEGHEAFLVNVEKSDNGSVSVADDKELATEGETVTLTPTAVENYKLKSLTVKDDSGSSVNVAVGQDGSYSFTMPASDVTVAAEFGRDYSINVVDPLPDGAKYITSDTIKAEAGTSVSGTIAAEAGWVLEGVTVTPVSGSAFKVTADQDGSYAFTMPESDVTISAEFKQTQVDISITDKDGNALAGATVELRNEGNNVVGTGWTSAATAQVIKELAAGTYTIVVTTVPQGYLVPTANTTFTMGADGTVSVNGSVAADGKVAVKLDSATAYSLAALSTEHGAFSFVVNGQEGATQAYEGDTVTVYFEAEAEYGFYNLTVTNASTGVSVHEMAYENSSPGLAETDRELSKVDASSTADEKALFTFTMPAGNVNASMTFNHICGYYNPSIKVVGDMSLNDWYAQQTAANPNAASYELPNGYYYLEESLEVSVPICFASGSYSSTPTLDLNGKTINFVDGAYLQVNDGVVASIRDCKHVADADGTQASGGLLKRAAADASGSPALVVGEGSTIYLFGGKIQGAQTAGTLDFRNGEIYAEGANAAVSVIGAGSISFMDGVISAPDGVGVQGGGDKKISLNSAKILAEVDLEPVWGTTVYATYGSLAGDFVLGGQPEVGDEYMIVEGSESYPSYSLTYDDLTKLSFNADSRLYDFWIDADANAIMFKLYPHIGFDSDGDGVDDKYVTDPDDDGVYKDEDGTSYIPDQDGDGKPEADSDDDGVYEGSGNPSDDEGNFYQPTDTDDNGIEDDIYVDSNGDGEFGPDENGNGIEDAVETGGSGDGTTGSGDGAENDGATDESDREAEGDSDIKKPILAATGDAVPAVVAGLTIALLGGLVLALRARRMVG